MSAILYLLAAAIGLSFATLNNQVSPVWPATGVAIGCIYLFGFEASLGIFLGAFLANIFTGLYPLASLLIAAGNSLEAVFTVMIFLKITRGPSKLGSHYRAFAGAVAAALAAIVAATNGVFVLYLFNVLTSAQIHTNWITWWVGDTLGAIFIVPFAVKLARDSGSYVLGKKGLLIFLALLVFTVVLNLIVFSNASAFSVFVILLFPLLLSSILLPTTWVFVLSFVTCGFAIYATVQGQGPFSGSSTNENLIHLQLFLAGLGLTALGLGTFESEILTKYARIGLVGGWLLTGIAVHSFYTSGLAIDKISFEKQINDAESEISHRLLNYITLLKSGASFYDSSDFVTKDEWQSFTNRILADGDYIGLDGLGVAFKSDTLNEAEFRRQNIPGEKNVHLNIRPIQSIDSEFRTENQDLHIILTYIEPKKNNEQAIGLDLTSELHRYKAAVLARDSGLAQMTGQIKLVNPKDRPPGFLLLFPFFKPHSAHDTLEERRKNLKGFIIAPIDVFQFFKSATERREKDFLLSVYSDGVGEAQHLIYTTRQKEPNSKLKLSHVIELAGQPLTLKWVQAESSNAANGFLTAWVAFTGILCTLFLALLLSSLEGVTIRAQRLADLKTREVEAGKIQWQVLSDSSPVGIFRTDANSRINYVNAKWSEITGLTFEEATDPKSMERVIYPEDFKQIRKDWEGLLKGERFHSTLRFVKKSNPNDFVVVVALAVPLRNDSGELLGFIGTLQDITELHTKQNALMTSSRLSSLGEMASGVAHEINNPLTIIMSRAQRIETILTSENPDQKLLVTQTDHIVKTAHRIAKIIKGLQSFARETTGEPFEVVSVKEVILNTIELCKERFSKHQVTLDYPLGMIDDLKFWGREEQISQVLMNLLNNAFDAVQARADKWVKVTVEAKDKKLQIVVTDSGTGISEETADKMFSPFFTTKEVGKGTGLGLSISKGIVERHGGLLYFDKLSKNTKFILELTIF